MPTRISPHELAARIRKLFEGRQRHADAIARIDQIFVGVSAALSGVAVTSPNGKAIAAIAAPAPRPTRKRRPGRGHFAVSAETSILAFVKEHRNVTSSEINAHLKGEGRSTSANNALGKLVKEKELKREPMKGQRGSRYSLA